MRSWLVSMFPVLFLLPGGADHRPRPASPLARMVARLLLAVVSALAVHQATVQAAITYVPPAPANGTVALAYSQSLAGASGGVGPYVYSKATGLLPAGLTLDTNGTLAGTPMAGGTFNFSVTATDSGNPSDSVTSQNLVLTILSPTIVISQTSLAAATVGASFNQTLTASGGTAPYSYAVTAGSLPAGLSLSSGGVILGTPTAGGTFNFTATATDSSTGTGPFTGQRAYTLTVNAPTISVAPASLGTVLAGAAVSGTLTASGGTSSYSFAVTSGSLPPGVSLSSGGALSGKATATGTYNFTITATDSSTGTGPFSGSRAYSWTINAPTMSANPVSGSNLSGSALSAFSQSFMPSGGNGPYSYGIVINSGSMPSGLIFSTATGTLSGTPMSAGTVNFTVTAIDATTGAGAPFSVSGTYNLTIGAPTVVVAPAGGIASPAIGTAYSLTFTASGATHPYGFVISAGALPAGLSLSSAGVLSGTPTAAGTFNFTVQATDANLFAGTRAYSFTIAPPTLGVVPATLPTGTRNVAYSQTVSASGGTTPYSFTVTAGALPAGLTLNSTTGVVSGTPTTASTYHFTITARDSTTGTGAPFTNSRAYSIPIAPGVALAPATLPNGKLSEAYNQTVAASGGVAPYTYSVTSGSLPAGLALNAATGAITGTPASAGPSLFTITATDSSTGPGAPYSSAQAYAVTIHNTVVTAPTSTGTGSATVSLTGGGENCTFTQHQFTGIDTAATAPPSGHAFPQGMFEFTAGGCDVQGTVQVTLTYPTPVPANAVLMKYSPNATPRWYPVAATINTTTNQVSYSVTDGGQGDDDGAKNGVIVDPVALAVPVAAGAAAIPTLSEWALLALASLLGVLGVAALRRSTGARDGGAF